MTGVRICLPEWNAELADERMSERPVFKGTRGGQPVAVSPRWIYVHMIEEYARHNGNADFLRERIDGVTGV